jgi:hypothetical protein
MRGKGTLGAAGFRGCLYLVGINVHRDSDCDGELSSVGYGCDSAFSGRAYPLPDFANQNGDQANGGELVDCGGDGCIAAMRDQRGT